MMAVGISLDYAPVLDVHTNPRNPVIGDRALGDDPEVVARFGRAIIEEMQNAGLAACGKHFPGHGDTAADSHLELPIVEHPPDRLRAIEFAPFKAAIEARVAFIMTAHVLVPSIDEQNPATLSSRIVKHMLRDELGYQGVIVSDDLEMKAISERTDPGDAAVGAIAAGCDALLMCGKDNAVDIGLHIQVLEALVHAIESGRLTVHQVEASLERNRAAKERFLRPWRPMADAELHRLIGADEHRAISDQMASFA
jgi:beta-N-acetylhexosaminidase